MSVKEIKSAISRLSVSELAQLANWFEEYQSQIWDKQIENDANAGKLDGLIKEADAEFEAGRCKPL